MADLSYVRLEMLPQKEPPRSSVGVQGWMRINLFSSGANTILTIVAAVLVLMILASILPWIFGGVWNASSLSECREIFAERYGNGTEYACWAVIKDRWHQIIFGYYAPDQYWRPVLGFLLILLAFAPVLFPKLPSQMFYITLASIFIYPWLIWGGTIWSPIIAALGVAVGYGVYVLASRALGSLIGLLLGCAAAILWWSAISGALTDALSSTIPASLETMSSLNLAGFVLSITIGIVAIAASLPLAIVLALGRQSDMWIVNKLCTGFIEIIRGVPLITLLFVATVLLNYFLPRGVEFDVILRVMILVTLFTAAYIAEVIRGGLAALPKGQYEAADALGLTYWQAQRLIILPQALKISIPGIVSNFISVFKDTTLVSIVALNDPLGIANNIRANSDWNGIVWELYGFIGLIFWIFCFSMSRYSMWLERRLQTGHH
ncbi:amino acid ABC transporter permease [Poseidonocella sedimentorum]|uniref:L-glutamine ABC transporter membrane protein /L-glutamate ABC transporter membrane protein /L-aspartate ABC transporter membrane protein /L-asparagine ABC transporter membrane protein n=1 Tax=Poseidonocella sedimentorum TaxID=871652 RepID=A0A1I6DMS4_9RHOB|nr:amino acid ABC transporter permease [Poseidonocella sedimentorum]SFR06682.1 L-glutamine ABC transporter membrane protein /L-glutamate ABC transporter membrane protein /L-aspartate ABC transporter membrane protein /L-asparagine ABC transporter membrane protein [Poseidonocella sedimentorum]